MGLCATEMATRLLMKALAIDGGVVFCKRSAFAAIDGYNEKRDVGEDVQLLRDLRRFAIDHGQEIRLGLGAPAILSTRKWDEHGDWHMFFMAYWPLLQRRSFHAIIRDYWYREQP